MIWHPAAVRVGVVLILLSLVFSATVAAHTGGAFWTLPKVMRVVDDKRIRVGATIVRVDADTTLCSGEGRGRLRRGIRTWTHFHCTFTTFTAAGPGSDVEFRVHALDALRMTITGARWIG
jgi:hypothetical protein